MKVLYSLTITTCVLALTACSNFRNHSELEALNKISAVGSPFTRQLTKEYRDYANKEMEHYFDHADAIHFARKGIASGTGDTVLPEETDDWDLTVAQISTLSSARSRLIAVMDLGAREIEPKTTAIAQARFDCWVEKEEENAPSKQIEACKSEFMQALAMLEFVIKPAAPVTEMPAEDFKAPTKAEPLPPEQAMYLVFFDFDKSTLSAGGQNVVDAVASELTQGAYKGVDVVGYTDSSGPESYNESLSMRRADAVKKALISRGVSAELITVDNRGETNLLVQTLDGIREPANRRAQITFR